MTDSLSILIAGESVELLADRALFWPAQRTLFIADPHFGKAGTFRKLGLAVPEDTEQELARLTRLIEARPVDRLIVLGDFFHARSGVTTRLLDLIANWRRKMSPLELIVVRGNHDRGSGDPPAALQILCLDAPYYLGPWACCHEPRVVEGHHTLAGHLHPGYRMKGRSGPGLRSPCFWLQSRSTVLPAFASFSGLEIIQPLPGDRLVLVGGNTLLAVDPSKNGKLRD